MGPLWMTLLLASTLGFFAYTATRRWNLMRVAQRPENRADRIGERLAGVGKFVFGQARMPRYWWAGVAHIAVFFGFCVLLLNSIMLWVRGYVQHGAGAYDLWLFGTHQPLGMLYNFLRDVFTVLVIAGVLVFFYNRVVLRLKRLTLNTEGLLILGIIFTMMVTDLIYHGVELNRHYGGSHASMPFASLIAPLVGTSAALHHFGFWVHAGLVLLFLNLLPYGKHFHILTVVPNIFARNLAPSGRLRPIEDIEGRLERSETLGVKQVRDMSWKDVLDLYTCTECGRCSDHCPATRTGKLLSPKHLTIALRDHLYHDEAALVAAARNRTPQNGSDQPAADEKLLLVPATVKPEVIWACTTCAACETECPVFITYIDKIVDLRRHLALERGEFPEQLGTAFQGLERVGNPYSYPNEQRAEWAQGLDIPIMAEKGETQYLYWVGCAPSFDDRSRKIARAFAQLLLKAGVDFAILGPEEMCNGDPARRAGNEFLFQILARQNVETLNNYKVRRIVTTCPHCYNTLKNEYPDFGGKFEVVHHTELLAELVRAGRLRPSRPIDWTVTYHDACYLGRHNQVYDPPRELLGAIPGLRLAEIPASRDRGMCCGAGGAQMWKEEEAGSTRVNHARMQQLVDGLPASGSSRAIASACPFCKTMLTDALTDKGHEDVRQLDVAELLWQSVGDDV
ncbi:MAG: (Fe-S)-binding protein [Phycisphaerales bacterium]|nr:(Fe-S)-binding protein [Phycisphaerales bacterium]